MRKLRHPFRYPLELDAGKGDMYTLSSAVFHHGFSLSCGHYTCDSRVGEDWYHFDDSFVRPTAFEETASEDVYLLFYERKGAAKAAKGARARKK